MASDVYVETTVPSAYVSTRLDPGSQHRRLVTQEWWRDQLEQYDAWISDEVLFELERGDWPCKNEAIQLVTLFRRLLIDEEEVIAVARRFIKEQVMPSDLGGDAVHLAVACVHEVDFLLTWNIRHLANPNKLDHLIAITRRLGLLAPRIVTPEMLWME